MKKVMVRLKSREKAAVTVLSFVTISSPLHGIGPFPEVLLIASIEAKGIVCLGRRKVRKNANFHDMWKNAGTWEDWSEELKYILWLFVI